MTDLPPTDARYRTPAQMNANVMIEAENRQLRAALLKISRSRPGRRGYLGAFIRMRKIAEKALSDD